MDNDLENYILAKNQIHLNQELQDNEKIKLQLNKLLEEEIHTRIDDDVCDWNMDDVEQITIKQTFDLENTSQKIVNDEEMFEDSSDYSVVDVYDKNSDHDDEEEEFKTSFVEDDGVLNREEDDKIQEIMTLTQRNQKRKTDLQKAPIPAPASVKKQVSICKYMK